MDDDYTPNGSYILNIGESSSSPLGLHEPFNEELFINPIIENTPSVVADYNYPVEDLIKLQALLNSWGLKCVYQTCVDQLIDMTTLSYMKSEHVYKLLFKFPLGIIFKFEAELEKWQKTKNTLKCCLSTNTTNSINISINKSNTETLTKPQKSSHNLRVDEVLTMSTQGSLILDYFKTHNKLNDGIRATLVDILIGQVLSQQIPMSDTYFMKIGCNKNPKGKLYAKYYNSVRNMKNTGLIPTPITKNKTMNEKKQKNGWIEKEFVSESGIDSILDILKYNDTTFPELESNWRATVFYRLNDIKNSHSTTEILNKWKQYKVPYGHKLIDIDYNILFPTGINIYQDFEEKSYKIFKLLNEKIKDLNCRKILDTLKNTNEMNINDNVKNGVLIYLLHALFAPTSKKVTRDEQGKKNLIKFSIKDSQDSFIVFGESVDVMQQHLEQLKSLGDPIQPFILIVGTIFSHKEILVYFDSIMYKVHSIVRSIEVCYKIFHLFNLEYPCQSSIVWLFVQNYFFGLTSSYDKPHPKLVQILSDLNNN
ncbi:hypothetical protein ACI65C_003728 [Semiaphis heraclei]